MINKVWEVLQPLNIPVSFEIRPEISPQKRVGISYHFFNEGYNQYGDGKGREFGGSLQVDVFAYINFDYSNIVRQVRGLLESAKFRFAGQSDNGEIASDVQYFHKILTFNYVEREVLGNGI